MQITISSATAELLRENYAAGVGPRKVAKMLNEQLEKENIKFTATMAHVRTIWTQLGLDPENQPKPVRQVEFIFSNEELERIEALPNVQSEPVADGIAAVVDSQSF